MNNYLSGDAPELAVSNLTDLILGRPKKGARWSPRSFPPPACGPARPRHNAGAVVAIEPRTGDILAMVSNPRYDPNKLSSGTPTR